MLTVNHASDIHGLSRSNRVRLRVETNRRLEFLAMFAEITLSTKVPRVHRCLCICWESNRIDYCWLRESPFRDIWNLSRWCFRVEKHPIFGGNEEVFVGKAIKRLGKHCLSYRNVERLTFGSGLELDWVEEFSLAECFVRSIVIPSSVTILGAMSFRKSNIDQLMFEEGSRLVNCALQNAVWDRWAFLVPLKRFLIHVLRVQKLGPVICTWVHLSTSQQQLPWILLP
jgi:hypothetical protein